jgi:enoyl-CoA hydratase
MPVRWRLDGRVAHITIDCPPANAVDETVGADLTAAVEQVEATTAKVMVVRSGLDGCFATGAGLDLPVADARSRFVGLLAVVREAHEAVAGSPVVSIAAIEGMAVGSGLELALACTLRVASRSSILGLPQVRHGLLPGGGGTQRLPRLIGRSNAIDLLVTGRSIDGTEAYEVGLVDRLAEDGRTEAAATALALELATMPGPALAAITRCVDVAESLPFAEGMAVEAQEILALLYEDND